MKSSRTKDKQFANTVSQLVCSSQITSPALIMNLDAISDQFWMLRKILPMVEIYFSVKSNPDPVVLAHLLQLGASFEAASYNEIKKCTSIGALPTILHYGNTIKSREDIYNAYEEGVNSFSIDSEHEVRKIADIAPNARVLVRIATNGQGAVWGLSKKFGVSVQKAVHLMNLAHELGLNPYGISFHVGSQQSNPNAWLMALKDCRIVVEALQKNNIQINVINLGGGLPANGYSIGNEEKEYDLEKYLRIIKIHIDNFIVECKQPFKFMIEPGRFMVARAGITVSKILLDTQREYNNQQMRWLHLDVGKFNGLYEATDIKLPVKAMKHLQHDLSQLDMVSTVLTGPSCDSDDMLLPPNEVALLPKSLVEGDYLLFSSTGAYSNSYAAANFNGFDPIHVLCVNAGRRLVNHRCLPEKEINYEFPD